MTPHQQQFAYPGQVFISYDVAILKCLMHFRKFPHQIQETWDSLARSHNVNAAFPVPTNITEFNGNTEGKGDSTQPLGRKILSPLELPHTLIWPLNSFVHRREDGKSKQLPAIKFDALSDNGGNKWIFSFQIGTFRSLHKRSMLALLHPGIRVM